ncbi:hypothetical protein BJ508DRAFT_350234 [Ascobolus immersus RN42]|uniref:DUF7580 domain-containing protein n=1 Tax=Ascobolus immersus RN42 TaxID=1160509 RepID=A0A3N4IJ30_ASCIM|nr:hypothetical protein BJ508DRAFT_350234 [Ascobolus immersus RN42]
MYFHGTPWICGSLTKDEISFPLCLDDTASRVLFDRPYISHQFPSRPETMASLTEEQIRRALLSLAFILLELCFGSAILSNELIENQTIGMQLDVATKWQQKVYEEFGERYGDAVRGCIYPNFLRPVDSDNRNFCESSLQEGVYAVVFKPLDETLKFFVRD